MKRSEKKITGSTFTPPDLARFIASRLLSGVEYEDKAYYILEPSVGEGSLLEALLSQIPAFLHSRLVVHAYDINATSLQYCKKHFSELFPDVTIDFRHQDYITELMNREELALFSRREEDSSYDFIIANPPYVRTQTMSKTYNQSKLRGFFGLEGRADLYHAFIVAISESLKEGGAAGIIVSNRFLNTKSGAAIRKYLATYPTIKEIIDLGDSKIFEAAVLPAILVLGKGNVAKSQMVDFLSIYEKTIEINQPQRIEQLYDIFEKESGDYCIPDGRVFTYSKGKLKIDEEYEKPWVCDKHDDSEKKKSISRATKNIFDDIFHCHVGIKTCADKVFIRREWPENIQREGLVLPLISHREAGQYKAASKKTELSVLYPYNLSETRKTPVDISLFPETEEYLSQHRSTLEGRKYLIEAHRKWYEHWVPHTPNEWRKRKIVFRDIAEIPQFWYDEEGCIVNGDCYWLTLKSGVSEEYIWLALAIANSSFIEKFYDSNFNNKLYSGRRRFMQQYVKKFPLPDIQRDEAKEIIRLSQEIYAEDNKTQIVEKKERIEQLLITIFGSFE